MVQHARLNSYGPKTEFLTYKFFVIAVGGQLEPFAGLNHAVKAKSLVV